MLYLILRVTRWYGEAEHSLVTFYDRSQILMNWLFFFFKFDEGQRDKNEDSYFVTYHSLIFNYI